MTLLKSGSGTEIKHEMPRDRMVAMKIAAGADECPHDLTYDRVADHHRCVMCGQTWSPEEFDRSAGRGGRYRCVLCGQIFEGGLL